MKKSPHSAKKPDPLVSDLKTMDYEACLKLQHAVHGERVEGLLPDASSVRRAVEMGFQGVVSGPFVRSSFHAGEIFEKMKNQGVRA
ncbi:MAG: hypothetical protein JRD04_00090 [Deltaproteobacteria bacterium]|nr:hypothetical protein [Deltaproteobacteria bacterium]